MTKRPRSLTGIKPTGMPHIGNWLGAIKPAIKLVDNYAPLYFIADYHALTSGPSPEDIKKDSYTIAATWLAMGLDPDKAIFYRQSDIPEIFELTWILSCFTPKGFMNRAHGYKDRVAINSQAGKDPDESVNMGFYQYPVLMAADILMFSADIVPIGKDQKQHLEFARDIADRVNNFYKTKLLKLPEPKITEQAETIVGLDGRKMSKSYGNTIPLFLSQKKLRKVIMKIVTNSQTPEEPKNPDDSYIFSIHKLFLNPEEIENLRQDYQAGNMGWGTAKSLLFEKLDSVLKEPREEYEKLMDDYGYLDKVLKDGSRKAREISVPFLGSIKNKIGIG